MQIMFMLVGDQTIPNLVPFIQLCGHQVSESWRIVLVTDKSAPLEYPATNIRHFLFTRYASQLQPENISLCEVDKFNLHKTLHVCRQELIRLRYSAEEQHEEPHFFFNMTSGTKLMALALYQMAVESGGKLLYMDSDHNRILQLLPVDQTEPLTVELSIADYLLAYGYRLHRAELSAGQSQVATLLSKAAALLANVPSAMLQPLTKLANQGELVFGSEHQAALKLVRQLEGSLWQIECEEETVAGTKLSITRLANPNFFPGGKWLERYAFDSALTLFHNPLYDVQAGLTLVHYHQPQVENELDLAFSWGSHLALCSCKAGNKLDSQWIYDLNDRARMLGTFCKKVLILNSDTSAATSFRERTRQSKILLLDSRDLPHLPARLATLFQEKPSPTL